ncbi:variable surface protein [Plasmodium gonderi]|uniref:Variable surface protein n=1 Tax=Plasmodium gonderi TaxID=77519 RepID=A0A1Y1JQK8_PLAGO|nr:variable surface protein [Plasmodium gonderi]GAW84490.1 variable surface protein [Plasmodium gonderi]
MTKTLSYENIKFHEIFPQFRDIYNKNISDSSDLTSMKSKILNLCNNLIRFHLKNEQIRDYRLPNSCSGLGLYLYLIKSDISYNVNYKNLACKYFNYKLQEMLNNYECNIKDPKSVYNKMKLYKNQLATDENSFLDICDNEVTSLKDSTFNIFKYFDQLYYFLPLIKNDNDCSQYAGKFNDYVNYLKVYVSENNSIPTLLNNLISEYNKRIQNSDLCANELSLDEIYVTELSVPVASVTASSVNEISEKGNVINNNMAMQNIQITHSGLSIGKLVGIIILSSVVLIMTFILHKYTRNASFIRRGVRRLKKLVNTKGENHNDVMSSSEETYKNRNYNQYKIAYV